MVLLGMAAAAVLALCTAVRWFWERPDGRSTEHHWHGRVALQSFYNRGAAFGVKWLRGGALIAVSCLVLAALPLLALRQSRGFRLGAGMAFGGGLSNLLERITHGQVFDYVQFPRLPGKLGRLVFNLADFALALGGILMVLFSGRRR